MKAYFTYLYTFNETTQSKDLKTFLEDYNGVYS